MSSSQAHAHTSSGKGAFKGREQKGDKRVTKKPKSTARRKHATNSPSKVLLRMRTKDSEVGITEHTMARLATELDIDKTAVLHLAAAQLARRVLPSYEPDDGDLTDKQHKIIDKLQPKGRAAFKSSLVDL